jgi:hypothetical protein
MQTNTSNANPFALTQKPQFVPFGLCAELESLAALFRLEAQARALSLTAAALSAVPRTPRSEALMPLLSALPDVPRVTRHVPHKTRAEAPKGTPPAVAREHAKSVTFVPMDLYQEFIGKTCKIDYVTAKGNSTEFVYSYHLAKIEALWGWWLPQRLEVIAREAGSKHAGYEGAEPNFRDMLIYLVEAHPGLHWRDGKVHGMSLCAMFNNQHPFLPRQCNPGARVVDPCSLTTLGLPLLGAADRV